MVINTVQMIQTNQQCKVLSNKKGECVCVCVCVCVSCAAREQFRKSGLGCANGGIVSGMYGRRVVQICIE